MPFHSGLGKFLKRCADLSVALVGLVAASPVLVFVAVALRFSVGRGVLFRQERPGLGGHPFTVLKFRTMSNDRDALGELLPDGQRLTRVGKFVRSTSLDELPQLFNVLRGDMSLVGPRPLLTRYLERYTPEQARRHELRPGITGWAQVNGRNAISWEEKFALDTWYVDNWSLGLDIKILFLTVLRVVQRKDVSNAGHETMPEFFGTPAEQADSTPFPSA